MSRVYQLDGRTLEGGGQLIRLALGLSALKSQAIQISHIRGHRSGGGGLKAQHLACVKWLSEACGAETEGASIKSSELSFAPSSSATVPMNYVVKETGDGTQVFETSIHIGSPGSVALVLQAVLPFILFRPPVSQNAAETRPVVKLTITGGTNVSNSPSYEYHEQVFLPMLSSMGLPTIEAHLERRGWSTGTSTIGAVSFTIPTLRPGEKLRGECMKSLDGVERLPPRIEATVIAPHALFEDFRRSLRAVLGRHFGSGMRLKVSVEDSLHGKRIYLMIVARLETEDGEVRFGQDELFQGMFKQEKEVLVQEMTERVVAGLASEMRSGASVDGHMTDHLAVYQALADGRSKIRRGKSGLQSLHAQTAEWICGEILGGGVLNNGTGKGVGFAAGCGVTAVRLEAHECNGA